MGHLKISQLKNQFVKDIANQCDIVKTDGQLEGKELSIFRERTQQAINSNLLKKEDLVQDLYQALGVDLSSKNAESAQMTGKNVYEILDGYTNQSEYCFVTHYIKNLNTNAIDFLRGYCGAESHDHFDVEKICDWDSPKSHLSICEQIATEYFYEEKEEVIRTLCNKVLSDADLYGCTNSSEYKTIKDIANSKDIVDIAESGALDKCLLVLIKTFVKTDDPNCIIDGLRKD